MTELRTQPQGEVDGMDPATAPERPWAALIGVLAVAVALGVSELVAALLPRTRSLVIAVGDVVIDLVPGWLERAVIATFGTADKPLLISLILLISAVAGAGIGILAARRFAPAAGVLVLFAAVGMGAALLDPQADPLPSLATASSYAVAGVGTLAALLWAARSDRARAPVPPPAPARTGERTAGIVHPTAGVPVTRRRFMALGTLAVFTAGFTGALARRLVNEERVNLIRQAIRIPRPARPAAPPPAGADLDIPGVTPLYMPNRAFYRIDTALAAPQVDPTNWTLEVKGRVDRPLRLSYDELLAMPHIEADVTLACVSNFVGGPLVGNARWQGVPLHVLLDRAGLQRGADQLVGRSVDDFTAGFPTRHALEVRESMVAVAMNGEPLPVIHGFPARLVVPGLYGYVSATKWLSAIELHGWEDFTGYWVPRGWAKEAPIKTQSRIDVPVADSVVAAGRHAIAGVAWAPSRGIERVEVQVDDAEWQEAELAEELHENTWRQWHMRWDATSGRHRLAVRATDGTGEVQTAVRTPMEPNGASGRHTITVTVQ